MKRLKKILKSLPTKIKTLLVAKFFLVNNSINEEKSPEYKSMVSTNKKWKKRLDKDSSKFKKTDNAMSMIYYLIFSTSLFFLSDLYLSDVISEYYIFMIDWILLLIFGLLFQLLLMHMRKLSLSTTMVQSAQIFIITFLSMVLAFVVNVITNEFDTTKSIEYIIIISKSLFIYLFTMFVFTVIEKSHAKTARQLENRLWVTITQIDRAFAGEKLKGDIGSMASLLKKEIEKDTSIKIEVKSMFGAGTTKNDFLQKLKLEKLSKSEEEKKILLFENYHRASVALYDFTFNDYYDQINIDEK